MPYVQKDILMGEQLVPRINEETKKIQTAIDRNGYEYATTPNGWYRKYDDGRLVMGRTWKATTQTQLWNANWTLPHPVGGFDSLEQANMGIYPSLDISFELDSNGTRTNNNTNELATISLTSYTIAVLNIQALPTLTTGRFRYVRVTVETRWKK